MGHRYQLDHPTNAFYAQFNTAETPSRRRLSPLFGLGPVESVVEKTRVSCSYIPCIHGVSFTPHWWENHRMITPKWARKWIGPWLKLLFEVLRELNQEGNTPTWCLTCTTTTTTRRRTRNKKQQHHTTQTQLWNLHQLRETGIPALKYALEHVLI